jgi:hypothetical protein
MCLNIVVIISIGSPRKSGSRNAASNIPKCTIRPPIDSIDQSLGWAIRSISFFAGATI